MVTRTRSRQQTMFSGSIVRGTVPPTVHALTVYNHSEDIADHVAVGNGHPLSISKIWYTGAMPVCNGDYVRSGVPFTVVNFAVPRLNAKDYIITFRSLPGGIPTTMQASALIAKLTNPSRPLVDLPVFIKELEKLPQLLFQRSHDIGADVARGRVSAEFGWKPLIRDLASLFGFKKAFDDRVREIHALRSSGIRRKRIIFNGSSVTNPHVQVYENFFGLVLYGTMNTTTTAKVTGFVKWVPDMEIPRHLLLRNDSAEEKALFALLGLNPAVIDASTIWEILPFSWLVDWCSNWGDLLAANRNIVGAHIEKILIMRHYLTEQICSVTLDGSETAVKLGVKLTGNSVTRYYETKSREVGSLELEAHMPFLSLRQVSILGDIVRSNLPGKIR